MDEVLDGTVAQVVLATEMRKRVESSVELLQWLSCKDMPWIRKQFYSRLSSFNLK